MSTSTDLILSKEQVEVLKSIRKAKRVPTEEIDQHTYGKYKFLFRHSLIEYDFNDMDYYELSDNGLMYLLKLEEKRKDFLKSFFSQFITGFGTGVLVTVVGGLILNHLI